MPTSPTTPTYTALIAKVRDWANRDAETLPDSIIKDAIRYGADNIYRELRLPPLEHTVTYTIGAAQNGTEVLNIPEDLSEFISLRRLDGGRSTGTVDNADQSIIYNQKADYRTFRDIDAQQYDFYRWTRRGNEILIHPPLREGEEYELYYYRRLPAMNATYAVNPANFAASLLVSLGTTEPTTAAPVTVGGVQYTSGTQLFFEQVPSRNITSWTVEGTGGGTSGDQLRFTINVDTPFTTAEQTAATSGATDWARAFPLVLYEGAVLDVTNTTQRRLWVHSASGYSPTFTNNGATASWTIYNEGGRSGSFTAAFPENFIAVVQNFNAELISQELIDTIPFTDARFTTPTDIQNDETLTGTGEWVTGRPNDLNAANLRISTGLVDGPAAPAVTVPAFTTDNATRYGVYFFGEEPPHWLRDEQEKIIIWMALVHIFDYLGEMEMMQKYLQKAQAEMQQLNLEEGRRRVSGGNTQQNFDGFLI